MTEVLAGLRRRARATPRRLVLVEGEDERVVRAAAALAAGALAQVALCGPPERVRTMARSAGVSLERVELLDPADRGEIARTDAALRAARGDRLDAGARERAAADPLFQAAARVRAGAADCMVAGAVRTIAEVVRSALWLIGLASGVQRLSSFFLMVVPAREGRPERGLVFADCAVAPDPDAPQLAEIGVMAADRFARLTGVAPRTAFLSFSTLGSASHARVDKVREAVALARASRPDLAIEGEMQADAALGGRTLERRWAGEMMLEFQGHLPPWADGHDVMCALIQRLGPEGAGGRWLEMCGAGLQSLDMPSRIWVAREVERLRSPAALFPSDEIAREHLGACGRDADWRRFVLDRTPAAEAARSLALDGIEPMTLGAERPGRPRPVRDDRGLAIGTVLIGGGAGASDLARLARLLEGHGVHPSVTLQVALGSRQVRATTESSGALARLREAGALIIEGAVPPTPASTGLAFGALLSEWPPGRTRWRTASLATCALAARTGAIADPRDLDGAAVARPPVVAFALAEPLRPAPWDALAPFASRRVPVGRPLEGPLRGPVLLRVGDRVNSEQVLPWGARVRSLVGDFQALSEHAFGGIDSSFATRARERGGGFVVAGDQFGEGVPWDTAALVLVQLGIRAVIARSIHGDFERLLAQAGILPLTWASGDDGRGVVAGDELELPGVPETFVSGRPIVARNLTQGSQYTLRHALGPRDVERLRRGGLLADIGRPR